MKTTLGLFFSLLILASGCTAQTDTGKSPSKSPSQSPSNEISTFFEEAEEPILKRVDKSYFQNALSELDDFQLIDVRTAGEFAKGAIEGAVNYDYYGNDFQAKMEALDRNKPTLIYCQSGGRSAAALEMLKELGFHKVWELDGGYAGW